MGHALVKRVLQTVSHSINRPLRGDLAGQLFGGRGACGLQHGLIQRRRGQLPCGHNAAQFFGVDHKGGLDRILLNRMHKSAGQGFGS